MSRVAFLSKLRKEGKLKLVNPSESVCKSYLAKSDSHLRSAKLLLKNDFIEESIALGYYSMYHSLLALLFRTGIKCENHAAGIILLKTVFDLKNQEISDAKQERIDTQYYVDFSVTKAEVTETLTSAERFNSNLYDFIFRLTRTEIEKYRTTFRKRT